MMTKRIWFPLMLLGFGAFAFIATVGKGDGGDTPSRAQIGFKIAPLPLNLQGKDHHLVGYGSYLVNAVSDCNGCHSTQEYAEGGNPFLGQPKVVDTTTYLRGGQSFGPFVSRNLRPEIGTGLPAGLTYHQFQSVIRHGTDYDNPGALLQVMPWPAFQNMNDEDIHAIYLYLWSLPAVPAPAGN